MTSLDFASTFIRERLASSASRPILVGIQGPQGSGKSYLASQLSQELSSSQSSPLRVVVLSIDDLYLPHSGLVEVAERNPTNSLLKGRGQPGTHDVQLGLQIISSLRDGQHPVRLPSFDKSLFDGEGDRLPMEDSRITVVDPPVVDVIILEGWFVGFEPISLSQLTLKWERDWERERTKLRIPDDFCSKENIAQLNDNLKEYRVLWDCLDAFIQLKPAEPRDKQQSSYSIVYEWRLEQEHYMKSLNGNKGMTDEGVRRFVDRYIPGYVFFSPKESDMEGRLPRGGNSLVMTLDNRRKVVRTCMRS